MELGMSDTILAGDQRLIDHIVGEVKSQGIFDQFRKECIADVDTKPAYQNLRTRVEGSVNSFLSKKLWRPDLNKNQLRETLRKHIHDAPYLDAGVERIVDQVVNPKVYSIFTPQIEDVVYKFLGIERPKVREKNDMYGLKDLLPKDLDPVSPESDKNSLKDLSLESIDVNDTFDGKQEDKQYNEQRLQDEDFYTEKDKMGSENGHISTEEKPLEETFKILKTNSNTNLNTSGKSDDKVDEEEEDSPIFEPIDIMNLNESNISNDSHLSGISELTSHRSKSPDFSNEMSRDNFDCSNQDSQLSKVSSDSRLSIVTDFGSSNHGLTPVFETSRDEATKDKCDIKNNKDNFKAIREFDSSKNKTVKNNFEFAKSKDIQQGYKDSKDTKNTKSTSRENSRDATDSGVKDKYEHKSSKEKSKDSESVKYKSSKEKISKDSSKDTKYKDKNNEKKKVASHSSAKYDKHSKSKPKEKPEQTKDNCEKAKDNSENLKDTANKFKDEKYKETDKKDSINKEAKDMKDLYKEKIRELREKKELTEKEKLNKDKDKLGKEAKDRKDVSKDKKSYKKEHKSSSSSSSSSSKNLSVNYHEGKSNKTSTEKVTDGKDKRSDSKDKMKREEKRLSKDNKSKSHFSSKMDLSDKSDKSDLKKISRSEKEDKIVKTDVKKDVKISSDKTNGKKDLKNHLPNKTSDRTEKPDSKKESKSDSQSRDKKRREDKKSKTKDDHSSLRKNSNDRRSTDRDGSNGSNSKTSQSNNTNSNMTNQKSGSSSLTRENQINSSSETSDNIEDMQMNDLKSSQQSNCKLSYNIGSQSISDKSHLKVDDNDEPYEKQEEAEVHQASSSLKRQFSSEDDDREASSDVKVKKPKFAKNIHEAKKLMKIRKQMEKQKVKEDKKTEKKEVEPTNQSNAKDNVDNLADMPDYERVQIIEIPDEEYDEPYPEKEFSLTLDESSIIMLGAESCAKDLLNSRGNTKATLSDMEKCIKGSLDEVEPNASSGVATTRSNDRLSSVSSCVVPLSEIHAKDTDNLQVNKEEHKDDPKLYTNDTVVKDALTERSSDSPQVIETRASPKQEAATDIDEFELMVPSRNKKRSEKSVEIRDCTRVKMRKDSEEIFTDNQQVDARDSEESKARNKEQMEICVPSKAEVADSRTDCTGASSFSISEDNEGCRYFKIDNERSEKFSSFLESLEMEENSSLEEIIESLGGKVVSSMPKSMAPPLSKPKRSSSPLSDILVNNTNNNNDGHKQTLSSPSNEDAHSVKKRKMLTVKKPRLPSLTSTQGIMNGENFVMPLSPDSDVSATSEKMASSNVMKEEKSRNRSSQRYSSDDLYKPRPLFSSSSRRSRRSNQA